VFGWKRLVVYGAVIAIGVAALTVTLPWYAVGPGPARAVQPLIRFDDRPRYESDGRFVMTSVRYRPLTGFDLLLAWLDPERYVVAREELFQPEEDPEEEHRRSISQMDTSKLDAAAVVLREVSRYPKQHGDGVLVESVVSGCAADGELYPGDRILAIDGEEVDTWRQASRAIRAAPSGARLAFELSVDGEPESVDLVRAPCGGSERPLVGVSLINSFPFDVQISSGEIGGSSAGLMWALGLYDLLTPGDLTQGRTIAGTGQIALDGTVGPIDGVGQKIAAAADAGATVFLFPERNADAAAEVGDHGLELVPVSSFDEAVAHLNGEADAAG
jgi:Lon-like protease